jgi:4-amino-4-deoxy-L-arabinose transferase-like glycosyltransferase
LIGYAVFIGQQAAIVAGGSDSSGYFNSARLLANGQLVDTLRLPPELGTSPATLRPAHFTPSGFMAAADRSHIIPTYPTGLPLHLAVAGKLLGWQWGPLLVVMAAAVGAVGLCYLVARELGLSPWLAAAGAIQLAVFPVFLFTSLQPLSDTLATTWSLAVVWAGLRARRSLPWAALAGVALAGAVLVRPTNLLLAPALLVLLGLDWRRLALCALGGLPGAVWLLIYNHQLYGNAFSSGYGDIFAAFAVSYGAPTALHFAKWLTLLLPSVALVLPFAALTRPELRGRPLLAFALVFAAITGCYAFYEVSHEVWWCLRFILPAVPALILAGLLGVEALARGPGMRWPRAFRPVVAGALALWALGSAVFWAPRLVVLMVPYYEQAYAEGALAARERLPKNALVAGLSFSGALYYYTDFAVLRWDQVEPQEFAAYAQRAHEAGRPVCAVLFESEEADAFRRCPGAWALLAKVRNVGLWQLPAPNRNPPRLP